MRSFRAFLFENLVGGSTPQVEMGVYTMWEKDICGGGWVFKIFPKEGRGASDFFHKKGEVGKYKGVVPKKGRYHLFSHC